MSNVVGTDWLLRSERAIGDKSMGATTMRASDQTLADSDELMSFVQRQCRELSGYGYSERYQRMHERFMQSATTTFDEIEPLWDLRFHAVRLFDVPFAESNIALYRCPLQVFIDNFHAPERLALPRLLGEVESDKFLRVLDYWVQVIPLTPPFLTILDNGRFGKRDGFHRLAAAIVVGARDLTFWCDGRLMFDGVRELFRRGQNYKTCFRLQETCVEDVARLGPSIKLLSDLQHGLFVGFGRKVGSQEPEHGYFRSDELDHTSAVVGSALADSHTSPCGRCRRRDRVVETLHLFLFVRVQSGAHDHGNLGFLIHRRYSCYSEEV